MAASMTTQPGSDAQSDAVNTVIVTDLPKLDIDLYIQNYTAAAYLASSVVPGRTRYDRLLLIGKCCLPLRVEAFKTAIAEAKNGSDVIRYKEAWNHLLSVAPGEPEACLDAAWVEKTEAANRAETARLEAELRGYKNNLIKESIRMGNEDLGKHLESVGMLVEAAEAYSLMRQDISTTKHIIDCGTHLANVALLRRDWHAVLNNVGKITGVHNEDEDEQLQQQAYIKIASGIAFMGLGNLPDAARSFLQVDFNVSPTQYSHIASPNDVAVYGGLLALATMDRKDLQTRVLDNSSFRNFLEHEPHLRKAISLFINGRYSNCLSILESVRSDYLLDIYLQPHISLIYTRIRTKCIVQYFIPFSCVTLDSLNAAFAIPGQPSIEDELVRMIREDSLKARIDTKNKLLVAVRPDPRLAMQTTALGVARKYEHEAKERLRRMNIAAAGLETSGPLKLVSAAAGSSAVDEVWYEENSSSLPPVSEIAS